MNSMTIKFGCKDFRGLSQLVITWITFLLFKSNKMLGIICKNDQISLSISCSSTQLHKPITQLRGFNYLDQFPSIGTVWIHSFNRVQGNHINSYHRIPRSPCPSSLFLLPTFLWIKQRQLPDMSIYLQRTWSYHHSRCSCILHVIGANSNFSLLFQLFVTPQVLVTMKRLPDSYFATFSRAIINIMLST